MNKKILHAALLAVFSANTVYAYELATHGAMTWHAYQKSVLGKDSQLWKNLGIDSTKENPFGSAYYDISGTEVHERRQKDFEKGRMPNEGRDFLTIKGWLMRGAIGEDLAEHVLVRNVSGKPTAFLLYLIRGEDGVWRIEGM